VLIRRIENCREVIDTVLIRLSFHVLHQGEKDIRSTRNLWKRITEKAIQAM
jgi:hypothetical protein